MKRTTISLLPLACLATTACESTTGSSSEEPRGTNTTDGEQS